MTSEKPMSDPEEHLDMRASASPDPNVNSLVVEPEVRASQHARMLGRLAHFDYDPSAARPPIIFQRPDVMLTHGISEARNELAINMVRAEMEMSYFESWPDETDEPR